MFELIGYASLILIVVCYVLFVTLPIILGIVSWCINYITEPDKGQKKKYGTKFLNKVGLTSGDRLLAVWVIFWFGTIPIGGMIHAIVNIPYSHIGYEVLGGIVTLVLGTYTLLRLSRTIFRVRTLLTKHVNDKDIHKTKDKE